MTALPVRCRNTNDALRKPFSAAGSRVRRARAERSWRGLRLARLRLARAAAPIVAAAHAGAPGSGAATAGPPAADLRQRHSGRCPRGGAAGRCGRIGRRRGRNRRAQRGRLPVAACGTSTPRQRSRRRRESGGGMRTVTSRGSTTRGAGGGGGAGGPSSGSGVFSGGGGDALSGFGCADHDPVTRRILHQVRGVPRRDHAEVAGRLGQRGRGLRLEHLTFQRFLLLQQRLIGLPRMAQLVGALRGVGRQPQRDAKADAERPDHQHHERHPRDEGTWVQLDRGQLDDDPLAQWWPDDLGRLCLSRLGPRLGLTGVLRPWPARQWAAGSDWSQAPTAAGAVRASACACAAARRPGGGAVLRLVRRGSSPPRTGAGSLCLHGYPPTFSSARSRTDALRGLTSISSGPARSAPRVRATNSGPWPGNSTG